MPFRPHRVLAALLIVAAGAVLSAQTAPSFRLIDVTSAAGISFTHNNGAFGKKFLPETLGAGAAFLDFNNDGRQDLLLVNGTPGRGSPLRTRSTALPQRGRRRFVDVTSAPACRLTCTGWAWPPPTSTTTAWQDVLITAVGQNRLFRNTGKGTFVDVTDAAALGNRRGSARRRCGSTTTVTAGSTCSSATTCKWTPDTDVFCSVDGKQKSYCTPEAYRGTTSWLFRNRGDGTFEDVTAKAGLFDATSKSLGVTLVDYDLDVWPDVFVANDTQPNKLYRNNGNGTFTELGLQAGLAFSEEGRARAGMGVDAADMDNSGRTSVVVTNFSGEMLGLYRPVGDGQYSDAAPRSDVGRRHASDARLRLLLLRCRSRRPAGPARRQRAHRRHDQQGAGARDLCRSAAPVPERRRRRFEDVAAAMGGAFAQPKVGRGAAFGDFDGDGDPDVVITSNGGPAFLYRNDVLSGNRVIRLTLRGTKSNRDAIGAKVRVSAGEQRYSRMVKTGSSYLSQSELPLTFGLGTRTNADRVEIEWPSGGREELKSLAAGVSYEIVEGKGIVAKTALVVR